MAAAAPSGAGPQHYCLRWNNYQSNLTSVFDQLLQNESFVDVTLAVAGRALKAHKVILSASSPYFQTLLHDNPCGHPIVVIEDVAFADMQAVVQFMYKGEINVAEQQLPSLLKVAEALKIRGLADVPDGEMVTRRAAPEPRRTSTGELAKPAGGSPELSEPLSESWPGRAPPPPPPTGPTPDRAPPPAPLVTSTEPRPTATAAQVPAPTRAVEETEIRPAIVEMIKEEERAMMMENSNSWSSPPEPTFQHQLQQAWQKSWNQQQSLLQNLRFRERGPLKSWRPETMAAAIMSVLREGHSLSQAARTYDIPYPTFVLYANRVHNLLGPSQEGPGGIPNELRPKGRGRPQRILLGVWPEDTVNNVIRAVVFRDTSGLKEQMESKAAAVAAAAAAAGHPLPDMPASLSKLMMQQQQTPPQQQTPNGRPHFRMQAPPMPPRAAGPSMPGGGGGGRGGPQGGLPHPPSVAAARHRPPNLLGFPDMHMMMGMFPPGMLSATGGVPPINLPPLLDQKPPVGVGSSAGPSPPARPVPGLSSITGAAMPRTSSSETDPAAGDGGGGGGGGVGGGPDPSLLEPLQEMTEGEEPLQVRRDLDSPATEGSDGVAGTPGGPQLHRSTPDSAPPAKRIKDVFGQSGMPSGPPFRMQAPPMPPRAAGPSMPGGGGGGRGGPQGGLPHPPSVAAARHRPPNLLGFPDMHMMMGMFPPGMLSATGAVPTINLPPLVDQKPSATKTASPPPNLPEVTISSVPAKTSGNDTTTATSFMNGPQPGASNGPAPSAPNGALERGDSMDTDPAAGDSSRSSSTGGVPDPSLFEPLQEMTEGDEPFQVRRNLDSPATEASNSPAMPFRAPGEHGSPFTRQMEEVLMSRAAPAGDRLSEEASPLVASGPYPQGEPGAAVAARPTGPPDVHSSLPPPTAAVLRAMP